MNNKIFLDKLHYGKEFDNQEGNLEICFAFKDKEGTPKFSKWKKYLDCDEKFIAKANNRTILPNEVVIDLEEPERFEEVLEKIKKDFKFYSAYKTGSKGYHIDLWFDGKLSPDEKKVIIQRYGCDEQKATERCMIALENCPHWKTGNPKTIVDENQGINDCNSIKKEVELKKEFEAKREIIDLLDEDELNFQYLDLGEINEEWYYGFKIKGREAIITSSGKIYRNTEMKTREGTFGVNEIKDLFGYEGNIGEIAPIISKETIKKYYTKNSRNHLINPKEIYKTIREKILYYMDFSGKDEIADVLTCWIIATYCYPLFYWFPHILFNAPSQSGKSKGATIVCYLSFRGFDLGASSGVTPAQIFRTLEGNRGTLLIDEFEQTKGNNQTSDMQQLVNQLLNASASKDAYVIRNEKLNNGWVAKKFHIFCPKIACNISGINPTSLSRYISFSWLKTNSEKGKRKPQREKDKQSFFPIREDLYILILEHFNKIKEIYENLEIELSNRDEDNWLPLFAISKFIDNSEGEEVNAEEQLRKYLENYKELQIEANDDKGDFFRILFEKVSDGEQYYTPKQIGGFPEIAELYSYLKSPAHKVGKLLNDYKFQSNRGGGVKKYLLSKELVKKVIDLYFNTEITPHNNTNNTKQHKQHTLTPENKENVGLCGVCGITPLWKSEEKDDTIDFSELNLGGSENE